VLHPRVPRHPASYAARPDVVQVKPIWRDFSATLTGDVSAHQRAWYGSRMLTYARYQGIRCCLR